MSLRAIRFRLLSCAILLPVATASGQAPARRVLPELRADVVLSDVMTAQLGGGVHITSGTYFRLAILGGAGAAWDDEVRRDSYRLEVQGRFHLDPMRTSRFGMYGIGGVTSAHDPFTNWQTRLVVGAGVELPAHGRAVMALEMALAGGFRISLATRRVPLGRR